MGEQRTRSPISAAATTTSVRQAASATAFPPTSWWFVTWRARVHDASTGNVDARLAALASALEDLGAVGGRVGARLFGPRSVSLEFWFEAATAREAAGGARVALRLACRTAGVGDPTPPPGRSRADVMLMFEELPTLHQDVS